MDNPPSPTLPRWVALVLAGLALALFIATCSPTVNFTDSGELIAVAWTGGIAHPPGYPLYALIGSVAVHLPVGEPAWRMNLVSVLFATAAVVVFYGLVADTFVSVRVPSTLSDRTATSAANRGKSMRTTSGSTPPRQSTADRAAPSAKGRAAFAQASPSKERSTESEVMTKDDPSVWAAVAGGVAASGLLAVSVTFWNWATQAKFYSLHYAFVAALLWLALRTRRALVAQARSGSALAPRWSPSAWPTAVRLLHLLVFTTGLSLSNHFLTFLLLPGIVILLITPVRYVRANMRLVLRHAGTLIVAVVIPLLLYLYLPIRTSMDPLIAWGKPDTWNNFWRHVTARDYQGLFSGSDFGSRAVDAVVYAANQFGPWLGVLLLVPVGVGLAYLWCTDRGVLIGTVVVALTHVVVVLNYSIREIVTYYVPLYMVVLWWAGLGVARGVVWVNRRLSSASTTPAGAASRNLAAALALGALLPLIALGINWGAAGHRDNYTGELFARNAFKNFGQNAVVLTNYWDLTSTALYMQHVLDERRDVAIIDKSVLRNPFYLDYLQRAYPEVVGRNAGAFAEYKALLQEWIDTGRTPQRLPDSYLNVLKGFIDSNAGQQPVYFVFVAAGNDVLERQEISALFENRQNQLVPDGLGYRLTMSADDLKAHDPQFDLRGITSHKVSLDEIEAATIALYPPSLQSIGAYLQSSSAPDDKELATRLLAQAQELQPFAALQDARPRLR